MAKKEQVAFLLQKNQKVIVDELTDEEAGIIFKAIYEYETYKTEPKLSKTLNIVFKQFKVQLDNYDDAYQEKCLKNRANIQNYWNSVKDDTNEYERIRANTNATNKIKINKNKKNKIKENKKKCVRDIYNTTPTLNEIINYGKTLDVDEEFSERFFNYYESIGWVNASGVTIKNWKLVFKNWLAKEENEDDTENIVKVKEGLYKLI